MNQVHYLLKSLLLTAFFLFSATFLSAFQSSVTSQFESFDFFLPVELYQDETTKEIFGNPILPEEISRILPGSEGSIWTIHTDVTTAEKVGDFHFKDDKTPGTAKLYGHFQKSHNGDFSNLIVQLPVMLPVKKQRSIFFETSRNDIYFLDVYGEDLYSLDAVLAESANFESSMLQTLLDDIKYTASEMKGQMKSPPVLEGRFRGTDLFTAMEKSEIYDLKSFIQYVIARPVKYRGHSWKISETYATWIDGGSPTEGGDMLEILMGHDTHLSIYDQFLGDIDTSRIDVFVNDWLETGKQHQEVELFDLAEYIYRICLEVSENYGNNISAGWSMYHLAENYKSQEEVDQSIDFYKKALEKFRETDELAGLLVVNNNYGALLNDQEDFKMAKKLLKDALEIELEFVAKLDPEHRPVVAQTYKNLGDSYFGLGDENAALEKYTLGLEYTDAQTAQAFRRKSALFFAIADVYESKNDLVMKESFTNQAVLAYREYEKTKKALKKL